MNYMKKLYLFLILMLTTVAMQAQFTSAPAFPGAEGYGRYVTGGRGGTVYHVTSLGDDSSDPQEGTLRYYISKKSGARIIVFDVAGTIELTADLKISKGDLSILGQTAPGQGICLKNYNLSVNADNVIVRFIRCRMGDVGDNDAFSSSHHDDAVCKGIIVDHCSFSWCTDEVASCYGNENFTMQWCLLSESLNESVAKSGTGHGFGGIWGGQKASFHHNMLAHNNSRNARLDHGFVSTLTGPVDYVNNVVYNWMGNTIYGGENNEGCESKKYNVTNNYYKPGPNTGSNVINRLMNPTTACGNCTGTCVPGTFYISGNKVNGQATGINTTNIKMDSDSPITFATWAAKYVSDAKFTTTEEQFQYNTISQHSADDAYTKVLANVGASLSRDEVDTRIINDATNGTGAIIGYTSSVISWPALTGTAKTDTDGDGMPDEWEVAHGLNPNVANAGKYNLDSKRYYTNIEVYANSLVEDIMKAGREGATETFEEYYPDYQNGEDESSVLYHGTNGTITKCVSGTTPSYIIFEDNAKLTLSGNNTKDWSTGSKLVYNDEAYTTLKVSNYAQNTFEAPTGKYVTKVKFISYVNKDDLSGLRTSFWGEVGGKTFGELIYGDPAKPTSVTATQPNDGTVVMACTNVRGTDGNIEGTPDQTEITLGGVPSFTFTNYGEQVCFIMEIAYGDPVGISTVSAEAINVTNAASYNLAGQRVSDSHKGLIIRNGKKYLVK